MSQAYVEVVRRAIEACFTARTTGIEFSQEVGELMEFRGGKIVRVRDFLTHAEALEAAGLSE